MRYSVEVRRIMSSNGDFEILGKFSNVSRKIVNFLMKNKYSFSVGIYPYDKHIDIVSMEKNYKAHIIIYSKNDRILNEILYFKLKKLNKVKETK